MVHVRDIIEATERCAPPAPSPDAPRPTPPPAAPARRRSRLTLARAPPSQLHRQPAAGLRVNVGGTHFYLRELIAHCDHPTAPEAPDTDLSSKRISSERLCAEVIPGFSFIGPFDGRELDEPQAQPANGVVEGALASSEKINETFTTLLARAHTGRRTFASRWWRRLPARGSSASP